MKFVSCFSFSFSFRVFVLFILCYASNIAFGDGDTKVYITWGDLRINNNVSIHMSGGRSNRTRVIVVDQNGNGDSRTVQGAVDMVPMNNEQRVKIHILPGIYREKVSIPNDKPYISFIGNENQAEQTVITWHDKAGDMSAQGRMFGTSGSASVDIESDYFCASWITFENTIVQNPGVVGNQAVALRISGDRAMFYNVRFLGSQDTLEDQSGSHYYYQCFIQGVTDFIFGDAKSLYEQCTISADHGYAIAAHHRETSEEDTGFSFLNCTVSGGNDSSVYLGRAWGEYSRVIYSYCNFDIEVKPEGWNDWGDSERHRTVDFGEFNCTGRGANRTDRAPWSKALNYGEAAPFLNTGFINADQWLRLQQNLVSFNVSTGSLY